MVQFRTYREEDLEPLAALIHAAAVVDGWHRAAAPAVLASDIHCPDRDPQRDTLLAVDEGGQLVGYTMLFGQREAEARGFHCRGAVHPEHRRRGVGLRLMQAAQRRARERMREEGTSTAYMQAIVDQGEEGREALLRTLGFRPVRVFLEMALPSLDQVEDPIWPAGYIVRPYRGEEDLQILSDLDRAAFADHWGAEVVTLEGWQHRVQRPEFRPDLCLIAFAQSEGRAQEPVGFCVCEVPPARAVRREGYVGDLAVVPRHRGQGLGTALLLAGLVALRRTDMERACLHMDTGNTTAAPHLYQRVGFVERRREVFYRKELKE